jgi:hypothetical protein
MNSRIVITFAITLTLACRGAGADDEAGTTTSSSTDDADETTSTDETSASTDESSTTDDEAEGTITIGYDMLAEPCDPFAQDCPVGEKCVPHSSTGEDTWDAVKCVPIMGDQASGEPCTYSGAVESLDDCDGANWCWEVDENGNGICHPFCTGSPEMAECPPITACTYSVIDVVNVCVATCDPVLQACDEGEGCYWTGAYFTCVMLGDIPTGEPCSIVNDCAEGNICMPSEFLPECEGSSCCSTFCDLELGDSQCAAQPGTACLPFFEGARVPPEYEHVGVCLLPP